MQLNKLVPAVVAFGFTLVSSSPLASITAIPDILNDTSNDAFNSTSAGDVLIARRPEIGTEICRHQYVDPHVEWIVQVPEAWWKNKYEEDDGIACTKWFDYLTANTLCGFRQTECFEVFRQWDRGPPSGWLHSRFITCQDPDIKRIEAAYPLLFDIREEYHNHTCRHGIKTYKN
jgi:hypothetical protein